jgi:hypothetical protein
MPKIYEQSQQWSWPSKSNSSKSQVIWLAMMAAVAWWITSCDSRDYVQEYSQQWYEQVDTKYERVTIKDNTTEISTEIRWQDINFHGVNNKSLEKAISNPALTKYYGFTVLSSQSTNNVVAKWYKVKHNASWLIYDIAYVRWTWMMIKDWGNILSNITPEDFEILRNQEDYLTAQKEIVTSVLNFVWNDNWFEFREGN